MSKPEHSRYYTTRPRRVPPEFCTDEVLEGLSLLATTLLVRIITQADDQGRLAGSPRTVRAKCFALRPSITERAVARAIDELVEAGFLIRYQVDGRFLLQVDRWQDLQGKWGRRAYPSRHPAPSGWTSDWVNTDQEEPSEVRAASTQSASQLRPPIAVPSTSPISSHKSAAVRGGNPDRLADIIARARRHAMTAEDAFELGTAAAQDSERAKAP